EAVASFPGGEERIAVEPGGDHDPARAQRLPPCLEQPPVVLTIQTKDFGPEPDTEPVMLCIGLQVAVDIVPGHPFPEPSRNRKSGQTRQPSHGMYMDAVILVEPASAGSIGLL